MIRKFIWIVSVISVTISSIFSFWSINEAFAASYTYAIWSQTYSLDFPDTFSKSLFETNQKPDIDSFYALINTSGYSKTTKDVKILGGKIEDMYLSPINIANPLFVNSKNLNYYISKYAGNPDNLNETYFIENLVNQNIPGSKDKNYASAAILISKLKVDYNALSSSQTTISSTQINNVAKMIQDIYKSQLSSVDSFNYQVTLEMIDKLNLQRSNYLQSNSYTWNLALLNTDSWKISDFINSYYSSWAVNTYNNLFTSNSYNAGIPQATLDSIKYWFLSYQLWTGTQLMFINQISGILEWGKKFNFSKRSELLAKLDSIKTDITSNINALNSFEISNANGSWSLNQWYSWSTTSTITSIVDPASTSSYSGATSSWTSTNQILTWLNSFSTITDTSTLNNLFKQELDTAKRKDLDYLQINKAYLQNEKTKLQTLLSSSTSWQNVWNQFINSTGVIGDVTITDTVQNQISWSQVDSVIANNINPVYNIASDDPNAVFSKLYMKHKVLSINNPLLWSEFITPPLTMSVVDNTLFRWSLQWLTVESPIENYRVKQSVTLTAEDSNAKWFSKVTFSYTPSPVVIKDSSDTPIGIQLGNKLTYYVNSWISIPLKKDNYKFRLYSVNGNFKNIGINLWWKYFDLSGWIWVTSDGNVKVSYVENSNENNFVPALWIKWIIK